MLLATEFELAICSLTNHNQMFIIEAILDKLVGCKKPISLHVLVKKEMKVDFFELIVK